MRFCEKDTFVLSSHAATRMAQRGISRAILDLVLLHGTRAKAGGNCEEYALPEREARQLADLGYEAPLVNAARKVRAIVNVEGVVVTCFHRSNGRSGHGRSNPRSRRTRRR